jgi:hypothetical protein
MPEQAVKTVLKKAVRAQAVELGERLFSARQIGKRTSCVYVDESSYDDSNTS